MSLCSTQSQCSEPGLSSARPVQRWKVVMYLYGYARNASEQYKPGAARPSWYYIYKEDMLSAPILVTRYTPRDTVEIFLEPATEIQSPAATPCGLAASA